MRRILSLALAMLLVACGSKGGVVAGGPDWLDGTSKQYPHSAYIVGVGIANSQEDAGNRARAEISKVFEVAIREQSTANTLYTSDASGTSLTESVKTDVSTYTSKVMHGVELADSWQDPSTGKVYVLATLHRGRAATALQEQIQQLDNDTANRMQQAHSDSDPLNRLAHTSAALGLQLQRSGLQRSLQVLDHTGMGINPRWTLDELSREFRAQLEQVRVQPTLSQGPESFLGMVSGSLGEAGFLVKQGETPDFILSTKLVLGEPQLRENWYWVQGRMEILLSTPQGRIRGTQRWPIKASATQSDVAEKRAMDKAAAILKQELRSTLLGFAQN